MLGRALLLRGDTAAAAEQLRTLITLAEGVDETEAWVGLAEIAVRRHDRRAADTLLARAAAVVDTTRPAVHDAAYLGWGYTALGDTARAFRILERYTPRADAHFQLHLQCDATLDPLRGSRRFGVLLIRPQARCGQ